MGTKGSYSGGGGAAGAAIRDGLDDWLASLPGDPERPVPASNDSITPTKQVLRVLPPITAASVLPAVGLFRSSRGGGADGPGGGGGRAGGGVAQRSAAASASAAGRGAAAAYAYRTGDADTLRELGLDYDELRANPDWVDVASRIAQAVCEDLPQGTIEDDELRVVVGDLVAWVLETGTPDLPLAPDEIAREALSRVLAGAYLTETAAKLNQAPLTRHERARTEREIRAACDEVAAQAQLSATAPTFQQFTVAVEQGLESLRLIYEGGS